MELWLESSKTDFKQRHSILSFDDYLKEVRKSPAQHFRNAAQYLSDVIQYFGHYEIQTPAGHYRRYKVFDLEFQQHDGQILGQEFVQGELVRLIQNFVRSGRIDRLILLHGPNGSAKTSLIQALIKGAEHYSHQDEGVLYRFNWIFPPKKTLQGGIGFGQDKAGSSTRSYAYLDAEEIESKISCEYKDHPLLLLPASMRMLLAKECASELNIPDTFKKGDLSSKNRKIFDSLLNSYHGDIGEVLRHVQVERFYLSKRYRVGIGTVEPQMSVDAYARQLTADNSFTQLPVALHAVALFESAGALNDGHRGILEYNDLLKRPIESWKYLLVATEQAQASLDVMSLFLDTLIIASSNELHLSSFREYPDWQSFKGRFELIKVPYLLRFSDELKIYQNQIPKALQGLHIAPHALEIAACWAVLTRLEPPKNEELAKNISPVEKLELYDSANVPERLTQKEARELKQYIPALFQEYADDQEYEGRFGASPREIRMILLNASQNKRFDHLSPVAVLDELKSLVREKTSYEFLRRTPVRLYRDATALIDIVSKRYLRQLDEEIKNSLGLIEPDSHSELFERYVRHVSAWMKKERILNSVTGKLAEPDADLMQHVESILLAFGERPEDFRNALITKIGAFKLEQPDHPVNYQQLFVTHLKKLKDDYYTKQSKTISHLLDSYLKIEQGESHLVESKDQEQINVLRNNLLALGYTLSSAKQAIAYLSLNRHQLSVNPPNILI